MALTDLKARLDATLSLIGTDTTTAAVDVLDIGQLQASIGTGNQLFIRLGVTVQGTGTGSVQFQIFLSNTGVTSSSTKQVIGESRIYDTDTELNAPASVAVQTNGTVLFVPIPPVARELLAEYLYLGVQAVMVGATGAGSVTVDIVTGTDSQADYYDATL